MGYILDLAVILLFVLAIFLGYRRGFVKSVLRLAGFLLAAMIAWGVSIAVANAIFDSALSTQLHTMIVEQVPSTDSKDLSDGLNKVLSNLPGPVRNAMDSYGVGTPEQILAKLQGTAAGTADSFAGTVIARIIRPVAVSLLRMLCFFILFLVLSVLFGIVASILNGIIKVIPGLRQINGVLGAVVGALEGVLLVLVAVTVIQLTAASSGPNALVSPAQLDSSLLTGAIADWNPITKLLDSAAVKL